MADQHQKEIEAFGSNDDFWIFGYGSLIWKPPPHYDQRLPGYIEGYVRRFWQASEDHRGTPEAPGRVVTLIEKTHWETLGDDEHQANPRVWGAAYHIPSHHVATVRAYLDLREINGYSIQFTPFHPALSRAEVTSPPHEPSEAEVAPGFGSGASMGSEGISGGIKATSTVSVTQEAESIRCLVYIGLPENPQFLGRQGVGALAEKILESKGPSGENKEYLYNLETALLGLSRDSGDAHISDLAKRCRALEAEAGVKSYDDGEGVLRRVESTEEQEEVEK